MNHWIAEFRFNLFEFDSIIKFLIFPKICFQIWRSCYTDSFCWIIRCVDFGACEYFVSLSILQLLHLRIRVKILIDNKFLKKLQLFLVKSSRPVNRFEFALPVTLRVYEYLLPSSDVKYCLVWLKISLSNCSRLYFFQYQLQRYNKAAIRVAVIFSHQNFTSATERIMCRLSILPEIQVFPYSITRDLYLVYRYTLTLPDEPMHPRSDFHSRTHHTKGPAHNQRTQA
jgi:hypothetical protein